MAHPTRLTEITAELGPPPGQTANFYLGGRAEAAVGGEVTRESEARRVAVNIAISSAENDERLSYEGRLAVTEEGP
jgi:hypothetical protein